FITKTIERRAGYKVKEIMSKQISIRSLGKQKNLFQINFLGIEGGDIRNNYCLFYINSNQER
ncbi:MAG: hypothetical protein M1308_00670, partial [Actinobacteria bacterium]|nr:hypothetical protein [Actinomycetota bacterium]